MIRLSKNFDKWQWLTNFEAQIKKMLGVLTDLYVSCVRPSTFNGQDEYAERELESMGNDLHNNSHYKARPYLYQTILTIILTGQIYWRF